MPAFTELINTKTAIQLLSTLDAEQQDIFRQCCKDIQSDTRVKFNRYNALRIVTDIIKNNPNLDYIAIRGLKNEYTAAKKMYDKIRIRYGNTTYENAKITFANKKRGKVNSHLTTVYWTNKGFSEDEAKQKIADIQSKNSLKRHLQIKLLPNKKEYYRSRNPLCIEYWSSLGYSLEEAKTLREEANDKIRLSYANYEKRHGSLGRKMLEDIQRGRKDKILEKYGVTTLTGKASKESLKFFIPLYKKIRKLGIAKSDIYWGFGKSKEYATQYNGKNFFYDFTIHSLKFIIEYNGIFWHAREDSEWSGYGLKEENLLYNKIKRQAMIDRGYYVYNVWSDKNIDDQREEVLQQINKLWKEKN